jgi:hypothetical protein
MARSEFLQTLSNVHKQIQAEVAADTDSDLAIKFEEFLNYIFSPSESKLNSQNFSEMIWYFFNTELSKEITEELKATVAAVSQFSSQGGKGQNMEDWKQFEHKVGIAINGLV